MEKNGENRRNACFVLDLLWNVLNGLQWRFRCSDVSSLVYFVQETFTRTFLLNRGGGDGGGVVGAAVAALLIILFAFVLWEIYLFLFMFSQSCFSLVFRKKDREW